VLPFIDGINYVQRISQLSQVHESLVKKCIRQLVHYGVVKMVDIFQYSNVYMVTSHLHQFVSDVTLQRACAAYVARDPQVKVDLRLLLTLYMRCRRGVRVGQLTTKYKFEQNNIDPRRFVVFGVLNGVLNRLHKYPVLVQDNRPGDDNSESSQHKHLKSRPAPKGVLSITAKKTREVKDIDMTQMGGNTEPKQPGGHGHGAYGNGQGSRDQTNSGHSGGNGNENKRVQSSASSNPSSFIDQTHETIRLVDFLHDGLHSYDELCCLFNVDAKTLDQVFNNPDCVTISRAR